MEGYSFHYDVEVRFRDTDAMGHVNNAVYLTYLEVARQAYWQRVAAHVGYDQVPFVVAHASIDFRSPVHVGETVRVFLRTAWVARSSFSVDAVVVERTTGRLSAEATTVLVTYDYATGRAIPVPDWLRSGLERAEGRPLPGRPAER